jgi:hypothetical protein
MQPRNKDYTNRMQYQTRWLIYIYIVCSGYDKRHFYKVNGTCELEQITTI